MQSPCRIVVRSSRVSRSTQGLKHILMQVYADLTLGAAENRDDGALTVSRHGLRTFICTWRIFRLLRSSSDNDKILAHLRTFTQF